MERTIVLENLDDKSATWIEKEAERKRLPKEQIVLDLIQQAVKDAQLERQEQQTDREIARQAVEALLSTGRARRLPALPEDDEPPPPRKAPPKLPGMPVSEILIAQRRGEL